MTLLILMMPKQGFHSPEGRVGGISTETLNLSEDLSDEWNAFVGILCQNHIIQDEEEEDIMVWSKNPKKWLFHNEVGLQSLGRTSLVGRKKWWWGKSWKIHAPQSVNFHFGYP
jgi:hypothetical protein